jgi:hypothetical protein
MKHARDMTLEEYKAKLAELRRGPPPLPPADTRSAKEMTKEEREEWLAEHKRRWR